MTVGIAIQLNPPIRLYTPKGSGYAHVFSQFGPESDQQWTVFLDTGEIWDMPNYLVRAQDNFSLGRSNPGLKEKIREKPATLPPAIESGDVRRQKEKIREKPATMPSGRETLRYWCPVCCDYHVKDAHTR